MLTRLARTSLPVFTPPFYFLFSIFFSLLGSAHRMPRSNDCLPLRREHGLQPRQRIQRSGRQTAPHPPHPDGRGRTPPPRDSLVAPDLLGLAFGVKDGTWSQVRILIGPRKTWRARSAFALKMEYKLAKRKKKIGRSFSGKSPVVWLNDQFSPALEFRPETMRVHTSHL